MNVRTHRLLILLLFITIPLAGLAFSPPDAHAYRFYSDDGGNVGNSNCSTCHTGFRSNNSYVSQAEGVAWGTSLHAAHLNGTSIGSSCDNCHGGTGSIQRGVNLSSSGDAADGVNAISCSGCHQGPGLRAHHAVNGITLCAGCHPNDPTPPSEDTSPPWYGSVTNVATGTNLAPCNENGEENFAGAPIGLDNDGDNAYDTADPDCEQLETNCFDGLDNDNDGAADCADPDCDGVIGPETTCGIGECASTGNLVCQGGMEMDTCTPGTPVPEVPGEQTCEDGLDNDCDGIIDNPADCGCVPTGIPETVCNGDDDDCDGLVDEDYMIDDTCGLGVCGPPNNTPSSCVGGVETPCQPGPQDEPADVTCDGVDGDCDGLVDEDFVVQDTTCGIGECAATGLLECINGQEQDSCTPGPAPEPGMEMTCDDTLDNDCDGLTDTAEDPDCGAPTMPPPVRQNIGFPDSSIADLTEEDCRFCHEDPNIVDDANIPNRHHNLVGTPVADPTVRPFPDGDTMGNYDCYSCHALVWDGSAFVLETFRDCIFCHNTGSPHHTTADAQAQLCDSCHGPVNNPFDGHQIPTTIPSLVTPEPSGGEGLPLNSRGNGAGACNYCHDSGLEQESGIMVDTNMNLHHNTGLFDNPGDCSWCHKNGNPFNTDPDRIRTCERCHGFESLHNIQADSNGDGQIIPNGEDPYWGHIGSNDDCWGCHGFAAASAPGTGGIIPTVSLLSQYSVTAGADTTLTLTGSALTNTVQTAEGTVVKDSQVVLTADDGTATTLATTAISESSMNVIVPASLAAGNYRLHAVKDTVDSNAVGLTVIPAVTITNVNCDKKKGVLTITGTGFGDKPEGTDADLNVQVDGQTVGLISWSDTQIKGSVDRCTKRPAVTVNALFGSATNGNCKGKKCR